MFISAECKLGSLVMPRRSLFLLAAAVVMLYFVIIMFMLSPLNGSKSSFYGHGYMNHFSYRQLPAVNWCKELRWRSPPAPHAVALVSYPGSGNTWLRYLLQQATGIYFVPSGINKWLKKYKIALTPELEYIAILNNDCPVTSVWQSSLQYLFCLNKFYNKLPLILYKSMVKGTSINWKQIILHKYS